VSYIRIIIESDGTDGKSISREKKFYRATNNGNEEEK
jgi:hypothetical protein